jgi:hypothetical protein
VSLRRTVRKDCVPKIIVKEDRAREYSEKKEITMKTLLVMMMLGVVLTFGMQSIGHAVTSEPNPPAGAPAGSEPPAERSGTRLNLLKGEVLRIDGQDYVIKDQTGKEVRIKTDSGTKIQGAPKAGDQIEAELSSDDRAAAIKKIR